MRAAIFLSLFILSTITTVESLPLIKVFCAGLPVYRGRVDPMISPGIVGNHVHKVSGSANFGAETPGVDPLVVYNKLRASKCNTCSLTTADNSAYWHPDLYYRWPNGSVSLVPDGGLTVYYEGRGGSGDQKDPKITAFPKGFRMTAGNPMRRSFNSSVEAEKAISFACLSEKGGPETHGFPDPTERCINGLRLQVYFPQCWNGKDLDSPDHQSHVSYPINQDNGGNCPPEFPVRLLGLFFEAFYSVDSFPEQSYQPFVLSCGDSTGYGFHGDFFNGWDVDLLQTAINDPTCDGKITNNGNNVKACEPLTNYVISQGAGKCDLANHIPLTEALGMVYALPRLPGCQNITGEQPVHATPCMAPPQKSYSPPLTQRFLLKSKLTGKYVSAPTEHTLPLVANMVSDDPSLSEVFAPIPWSSGSLTGVSLMPEAANGVRNYCSTSGTPGAIVCLTRDANNGTKSHEAFKFEPQPGGYIAIKAYYNMQYVTVQDDGTLVATSTTIGDGQLFQQLTPDGGHL